MAPKAKSIHVDIIMSDSLIHVILRSSLLWNPVPLLASLLIMAPGQCHYSIGVRINDLRVWSPTSENSTDSREKKSQHQSIASSASGIESAEIRVILAACISGSSGFRPGG
jgi:hypothetical protein